MYLIIVVSNKDFFLFEMIYCICAFTIEVREFERLIMVF